MKAALYEKFGDPLRIQNVPDPSPTAGGVVLEVKACGICRSDWHGWVGHDPTIALPNVPGHELSGVIETVGSEVSNWIPGDRVTLPFVCGCGKCPPCLGGDQQVCDQQFQPGFTAWGGFADYVAVDYADLNLVRLPDEMEFTTAAILGCRFMTAFRAVVDQGRVKEGEWVAVHGCGGVGLSAIMIARAMNARVVAVDTNEAALDLAKKLGADVLLKGGENVGGQIRESSGGGVQVSLDALGSRETYLNSIDGLGKRGRHVQVGLMKPEETTPPIPMDQVIANELEILGSHGMQAHRFPAMMEMISGGRLRPRELISKMVTLEEAVSELESMDLFRGSGMTVMSIHK